MRSGSLLFFLLLAGTALPGFARDACVHPRNVSTGAQLLEAIVQTNEESTVDCLLLTDDVKLRPKDVLGLELPLTLRLQDLTIASANATRRTLDWGRQRRTLDWGGSAVAVHLLWVGSSSHLRFRNLHLQGAAPPSAGHTPDIIEEMPVSPFWPTVSGDSGCHMTLENVVVERVASQCDAKAVAHVAATAARVMAGGRDSGRGSGVTHSDLTVVISGSYSSPSPILDQGTKMQLGTATFHWSNCTVTCHPDPGVHAGAAHWAWALTALAAAVAATMVALRQRERLRQQHMSNHEEEERLWHAEQLKQLSVRTAPTPASEGSSPPGSSTSLGGSGGIPGGRQPSEMLSMMASSFIHTRVGIIEGLELGELLGRGSFGSVYRGRWKNAIVAVKIIETCFEGKMPMDISREPILSLGAVHPNIVSTFRLAFTCVRRGGPCKEGCEDEAATAAAAACCQTPTTCSGSGGGGGSPANSSAGLAPKTASQSPSTTGDGSGCEAPMPYNYQSSVEGCSSRATTATAPAGEAHGSSGAPVAAAAAGGQGAQPDSVVISPRSQLLDFALQGPFPPGSIVQTWMVLELCDRGSLTNAVLSGKFFRLGTQEPQLDLPTILLCLADIAQGMEYLHSCGILHSDLKGRNVLLKSTKNDRRGYVCKVSDFGLSRMLDQGQTHIETASCGTATHAAPELLLGGRLTRSSDVYAFGIIAWEMVAGEEAFSGLSSIQVIAKLSCCTLHRPEIPAHCPPQLAALIERCWSANPLARPTFSVVVEILHGMLRECRLGERARSAALAEAGPQQAPCTPPRQEVLQDTAAG